MAEKFSVLKNDEIGRYAVASQDLKEGEIFLEESPFVIGPKVNSPPLCLECYVPVDGSSAGPRCSKCSWPLCETCATGSGVKTHALECEVFAKSGVKFQPVEDSEAGCLQLDCITPLRLLLVKEANPKRWTEELESMEHHEAARKEKPEWMADATNVVNYLRGPHKLDRFPEDLIQRVIGILEVNAFEARTENGYPIRCLYPKLAILSHSCVPNTTHTTFASQNFKLIARTTIPVKKGDQLHSCYTYTTYGTAARQIHLKQGKFFTCRCPRCLDPTELGTHFSSFRCSKCEDGVILSTDPLDINAKWKCNHCEFSTSGAAITQAVTVMQEEIDNILYYLDYDATRLEKTEELFNKFRSVLHPRHFILTNIRQGLIEMYGRLPGYEMSELTDILLERKIELCQDVLKVLEVVEPGKTRARAMILYEMHAPMMMMARSQFRQGLIFGEALKKKLQEAVHILEEVFAILSLEDPVSQEGILAGIAKRSAEELRQSIEQIKD